MQDIKKTVRDYILDNFLMGDSGSALRDDQSFLDNGIIDSTGFVELITFLESHYNVQVRDNEMTPENLDSLDNVEQFMTRKLAAA
jgi:acyl carrier protein